MQIVNSFYSKEFHTIEPKKAIELIQRDETLKVRTALYRKLMAEAEAASTKKEKENKTEEAQKVKKSTQQMAISFRMEGGKEKANCHECLYCALVDFDAKNPKEQLEPKELERVKTILRTSRHALMGYESISGKGYHIVVPFVLPKNVVIDLEANSDRSEQIFKRAHSYINKVYSVWCGHTMDAECGNINRMMGLSHDPLAVYRKDAVPFHLTHKDLGIDEQGNLINMKSPRWAKDKQGNPIAVKLDDHLERAEKMVEESGTSFSPGNRHNYIMRVGFILNRMGVDEDEAAQALNDAYLGKMDGRPSAIVHSCYRTAEDEFGIWAQKRSDNTIKTDIIANYLKNKELQYDILTQKTQIKKDNGHWVEMNERDENDLYMDCCTTAGINITSQLFHTVLNSNIVPQVNPLKNYVMSRKEWSTDQPDYIDQAAGMVHMATDNENLIWHQCFKKWFTAMVAGWMEEYVVNHQVIVLIGRQGIYKSTWINRLMPAELKNYGTDNINVERLDKDEKLRAAEYGLINIDELDKLTDRELNKLKAMITTTHIDERASYGRHKEKRVRVAAYAASGNKTEFLTDLTGNRRWLPFHVASIDSPYEQSLPYDGMYAQALYLLKNGFNYWFSIDEIQMLEAQVSEFMVPEKEEQLLQVYFAQASENEPGAVFLTTAEIAAKLTTYGVLHKEVDPRRLGSILSKLGYLAKRSGHNGSRGYIVRERTAIEIQEMRSPKSTDADIADIADIIF